MILAFKICLIVTILLGLAAWISKIYAVNDDDTKRALIANKFYGKSHTTIPMTIMVLLILSTIIGLVTSIILGIIIYL